jgi:hypothetical protein
VVFLLKALTVFALEIKPAEIEYKNYEIAAKCYEVMKFRFLAMINFLFQNLMWYSVHTYTLTLYNKN